MKIWFESLMNGIKVYGCLAPLFFAAALFHLRKRTGFRPATFLVNQLAIMYIICLLSVTLFPLPTSEQAARLSTHDVQLIPFRFVGDILRERSLQSVAQVLFNIMLTAPLGLLLVFKADMNLPKAALITFCVSLLIEVAQLTGLFFIFNGSYRLFDVDDLFLNTLGGVIGFRAAYSTFHKLFPIHQPNMVFCHRQDCLHILQQN